MSQNNLDPKAIIREAWFRGFLKYKLDQMQMGLYDQFYNFKHKILTWLLARRSGKTFTLCVLAIEQCLRKPNSIVKFISPTKIQVNQNIRPILRTILEDCPEELKPEFRHKDYIYYFTNGSELQLAGSDGGHAERLRGGDSHLFIVDEAGSCSDLKNVVKSILLPTTLITKGRGILASTPPIDSEHEFLQYIEEAELRGSLTKKTIDDNPRINQEQKEELFQELGGKDTAEARRELYCEIIKDPRTSVLPEFTPELEKEIVKDWPRPPFFDTYEAMDTGGKDFTVVLFGYYDFRADKVIVEDEIKIDFQNKNENIELLVKKINEKEIVLWTNKISKEYRPVYDRVSDIDYILTTEISKQSSIFPREQQIHFRNAAKDNSAAAVNNLRIMLANKKIIIHPRCQILLRHLRNVKWNKQKSDFARSADDGHYDAVAALKYLVRSIEYRKNPYPTSYNYDSKDLFVRNPEKFQSPNNQVEVFRKIFNIPTKRKF